MKLITTRQTCLMLMLTAITFKLMFLPSLLSSAVNNDTFIAILFLGALEFLAFGVLLYLGHKYPDLTFKEILIRMFGKVLSKIILIMFSLHFLMHTIAAFIGYFLYLYFTLYSDLHWLTFAVPMIFMLFYVITVGLKGVGRLLEIFVPIILIVIVVVLIFGSIPADFSNVLPIFENGFLSSTLPALNFTLWGGNFLVYVIVMGNIKQSKNHTRNVTLTVLASIILIAVFYIIYISLFSYNAGNYDESTADLVSILPQSSNVASLDWIIALIWCVTMLLFCVVSGMCSQFCVQETIGTKYKWQISALICIIIFSVAAGLNFDIVPLISFGMNYGKYFDYVVQFLIPLLMFIFAFRLKSDRSDEKSKGAENPLKTGTSANPKFENLSKPQSRTVR